MRRHHFLRASSAEGICLFCASRLAGAALPVRASPAQRAISTTRLSQQEAIAVATSANSHDHESSPPPLPDDFVFDPDSTLSRSEQVERVRLQAAREAQNRQRQEVEAERQRQFHKALQARQNKQKEEEKRRQVQEQRSRHHNDHTKTSRQSLRISRNRSQLRLTPSSSVPKAPANQSQAADQRTTDDTTKASLPIFGSAGTLSAGEDASGWGFGDMDIAPLESGRDKGSNVIPVRESSPTVAETSTSSLSPGMEEVLPHEESASDSLQTINHRTEARDTATNLQPLPGVDIAQSSHSAQNASQNIALPGESGYQSLPFNPNHTLARESSFSEDNTASWQHLRRTGPKAASPSSEPRPLLPPASQTSQTNHDESWIDEAFQKHREGRPSYSPLPQSSSEQYRHNPSGQQVDGRSTTICFRCREPGHIARDCPKAEPMKCYKCGLTGHATRNCPQNNRSFIRSTFAAKADEDASRRPSDRLQDKDSGHSRTRYTPNLFLDTSARKHSDLHETNHGNVDTQRIDETNPYGYQSSDAEQDRVTAAQERRMRKFATEGEEDQKGHVSTRPGKFFNDDRKRGRATRRSRDEDDDDMDDGVGEDWESMVERKTRRKERKAKREREHAEKAVRKAAEAEARKPKDGTPITLPEFVTVATLAQLLNVRYESFIGRLESLGYDDIFPGKALNAETSGMIAMEYGFDPSSNAKEVDERDLHAQPELADQSMLPARPPVVTIMGHVDHGKTTILDYLRKSSVAAGEAGGITQHIGAFSVPLSASGKTITFLDTPGHAAFLAMRERGANVTDIVVLVVAADDSVKPQTIEAIKHAKAAGVPIIVAVNKIDKEEADMQRVKQDLSRHGVDIEDFGGETQVVPVSGKTGQGMDELEENIVALSEILDHRADFEGVVEGWVLEASTKKAGRVATVLVRRGTLKVGSIIVAGNTWARVRALRNEAGQPVEKVWPGMPIEVDGWRDQPMAGDEVLEAPSEQKAHDVVEYRLAQGEREKTASDMEAINEARKLRQDQRSAPSDESVEPTESLSPTEQSGHITVPFVIRADVSGSAEAVSAYIQTLSNPLVSPLILESGVGPVRESDIDRADAASGHIISFNVINDEALKNDAESRGVKVLENNIIYRALDDVKAVLEDTLPPVITQRVLGEAEVGASFDIGLGGRKTMKIAGCKVRNGVVGKGSRVRVTRGTEKVYDGTISSLKNVKKDVQEMRKGTECGMGFDGWEGFEVSDVIQTYEELSEKRRL